MRVNIHAGQIGHKALIPVLLNIQHKRAFGFLCRTTKSLRPQEYPKFQRHIEPWQVIDLIQLSSGNIVNSEPAFMDNIVEFFNPGLRTVIKFPCRAGDKSTGVDNKNQCIKDWLIV